MIGKPTPTFFLGFCEGGIIGVTCGKLSFVIVDNGVRPDELAVCVHFATIYGKSATLLGENGVRAAKVLQEIADRIVLGG